MVNYTNLDLLAGIIMMIASMVLSAVSPWLYLITLIAGMNLAMGNLRYFYNKKRGRLTND